MSAELLIRLPDYFSSLINAMQDGFVLRGTDATIIEVNDAYCRMIDRPRSEIIGTRPPYPWWPEERRTDFKAIVDRYLSGAASEDRVTYERANGEHFPALVTSAPLRDSEGRVIGYIGTIKDMTEWDRAEEHVRFQAHLIDEVEAAVSATDANGRVIIWNRGAERLYGVTREQAVGAPILEVVPGQGDAADGKTIFDTVQGGARWEGEYSVSQPDVSAIPIFGSIAPILDQTGSVVGTVAVAVDISQRKHAEERLTAQYRVARDLAEAPTAVDGLERVLSTIGNSLGFRYGQWWRVDTATKQLVLASTWLAATPDTANISGFEAASRAIDYTPHAGLPGLAWGEHQPVWVTDITRDKRFLRREAAARAGLHTGIAIPVNGGPTVLGVLEFFSADAREPDIQLLDALSTMGSQIGQFVERRRAESAVRESEDRFRAMANSAPVLLWVAGPDGLCTWFNTRWLDFTGRTMEQELGYGWSECIHLDDLDQCVTTYREAFDRREPFEMEYRMRRHDGEYRWLLDEGVPRIDPDGTFVGFIGSAIDITDRRRAAEDQAFVSEATRVLASSLEYETTLVAVAQLAVPRVADWCVIHMLDDDGKPSQITVAHADPAKVEWARELQTRYPSDPDAPGGVPQVLRTGEPELYPDIPWEMIEAAAHDEEHRELLRGVGFTSAMIVPIKAGDRVLGVLSFISSETGRHYTERDLALAEQIGERAGVAIDNARLYRDAQDAARARDQFLAVAAHELRSPLTSMKGFAQLLLRRAQRVEGGDEWIRPLETIDAQVNRVAELVSRLLDVSRIEERRLQLQVDPVDLFDMITRTVGEVQLAADRHAIVIQASGDPVVVELDAPRVQQVLSNLLDNAIKYSPDGTVVTVQLDTNADEVVVSVRDQGDGIPENARQQLFERYFRGASTSRSASEGLGLGLYVAHGIVEAHGGRMWLESDIGTGSTFAFALPWRQPQAAD